MYRMVSAKLVGFSAVAALSAMWIHLKEICMLVPVTYAVCGWCGVALCGGPGAKTPICPGDAASFNVIVFPGTPLQGFDSLPPH